MDASTGIEENGFRENIFGILNQVITLAKGHPEISVVIILAIVVFVVVLLVRKIVVIPWLNVDNIRALRKLGKVRPKLLTKPAARCLYPDAQPPVKIKQLIQGLKKREHKFVQLSEDGVELGRLLFHKLREEKGCDYIGWIECSDIVECKQGENVFQQCLNAEIQDLGGIEHITNYPNLFDLLEQDRLHTVLIVNMTKRSGGVDESFERYTGLKGLSMILISGVTYSRFEQYSFDGEEELS